MLVGHPNQRHLFLEFCLFILVTGLNSIVIRILHLDCATEVETREKLLKGYVSIAYADRLLDQSKAGDPYSYTSRTLLKSIGYDTETNI
jgi:hypothetical protein